MPNKSSERGSTPCKVELGNDEVRVTVEQNPVADAQLKADYNSALMQCLLRMDAHPPSSFKCVDSGD